MDEVQANIDRAQRLLALQRFDDAIDALGTALASDPTDDRAVRDLCRLHPESGDAWQVRTKTALACNSLDAAERAIDALAAIDPASVRTHDAR